MSDEQNIDQKHSFNPFPLAAWFSGALVLYFLSIGPLAYFNEKGIISDSTLGILGETFYAPIVWLTDESETVNQLVNDYVSLWK